MVNASNEKWDPTKPAPHGRYQMAKPAFVMNRTRVREESS